MTGWASTPTTADERRRRSRGFTAAASDVRAIPKIVLVTTSEAIRGYFYDLTNLLTFDDVHTDVVFCDVAKSDGIQKRLEGASLVVLGTCKKQSVLRDSPTCTFERTLVEHAVTHGVKVAICSEHVHEVAQPHLDAARATKPLVIVNSDDSEDGALLEMFPIGTDFIPREITLEGMNRVRRALLQFVSAK